MFNKVNRQLLHCFELCVFCSALCVGSLKQGGPRVAQHGKYLPNEFIYFIHSSDKFKFKEFSYPRLKAVEMPLQHVNSQSPELASEPRSFLWETLLAHGPLFTSRR